MADKVEYPKWLYRGAESRLVQSAGEREKLGESWAESPKGEDAPAAFDVRPAPKKGKR